MTLTLSGLEVTMILQNVFLFARTEVPGFGFGFLIAAFNIYICDMCYLLDAAP